MRRMKTKQIESTVTKSGNSGHIIVPKDWIGQEVVVKIKEDRKERVGDQNKRAASVLMSSKEAYSDLTKTTGKGLTAATRETHI